MRTVSSICCNSKRPGFSDFQSRLCAICCFLLINFLTCTTLQGQLRVDRGELQGAKFTVAVPENWNGHLLLLAHGGQRESAPLNSDFAMNSPTYQHLLADGWMIASTSYRRNGDIVVEAVEDIDVLRQHIVETYGPPQRTLVQGSSMGGTIVTLIAETRSEDYDGVLALGAALEVRDAQQPHQWTYKPRIPLLFVSNQTEVEGPRDYVHKAAKAPSVPVFWYVARDGHVNLREIEQETALRALDHYVETGQIQGDKDATIVPDLVSSAEFSEGGAYTQVTNITSDYGNIDTQFTAEDLQTLAIAAKTHFQIQFEGRTFRVLLATTYGDVKRGEWVAFVRAEGRLRIARNYENAAQTLECEEGDKILILPDTTGKE